LFAEDEQLVRNLARQTLTSGGYRVLVAKDGHEALALYQTHAAEIALVVLDVVMPGLSGKAVADRIKSYNPQMPILFCSGYDFSMLESTLSSGEATNVVRKPYSQRELLRRIREALDMAKGNQ
jgi:two-component system, cell cycle sensor histidine kinase and response regulator CckA